MTNNHDLVRSSWMTDWSAESEQQFWYDQFKSPETNGLRFNSFQDFLQRALYPYFESFPGDESPKTISDDNHGKTNGKTNGSDSSQFTHQQEMQLFKAFDQKNDHVLDFDEFSFMCQKWLDKVYRPASALVVVDVQNDFIDGSLALINGPAGQDGAEVVPTINSLLDAHRFRTVVYTQDWHPVDHIGFHSNLNLRRYRLKNEPSRHIEDYSSGDSQTRNGNDIEVVAKKTSDEPLKYKKMNPKAQVFDTVLFDDGRVEQKLWPTHCVQGSWGAQLHPKLKIVRDAIRIQKGTLSHVDAYSAFWDNMRMNETGLRQELQSRKISDLYFCGLALDYCVSASAIDSTKAGFITYVIEDACRGIDLEEMEHRKTELREQGVLIISSGMVSSLLEVSGDPSERSTNGEAKLGKAVTRDRIDRNTIMSICFRRALL